MPQHTLTFAALRAYLAMTSGKGKGSTRGSPPLSDVNSTPLGPRRSARLHGGASAPLQPSQQPAPVTDHVSTQDAASIRQGPSITSTEPELKKREREDEPDPVPKKRAKISGESNDADDSEDNTDSKASTPESPCTSSPEPVTNEFTKPRDNLCNSGQLLSTASPPEIDTVLSLEANASAPASDDLSSREANACAPTNNNFPVTPVNKALPTAGLPLSPATSSTPNHLTNEASKVSDTEYQSFSAHVRLEQQQRRGLGTQSEVARVHYSSLSPSDIARIPTLHPIGEETFEAVKYLEDPHRQHALAAFHGRRASNVGRDLMQGYYTTTAPSTSSGSKTAGSRTHAQANGGAQKRKHAEVKEERKSEERTETNNPMIKRARTTDKGDSI